ncbi:MAG: hypothetical protein GC134_08690 [Proteobacteria bacterium]|nr:hypothetical protein [Pseudomonadota bacterium]
MLDIFLSQLPPYWGELTVAHVLAYIVLVFFAIRVGSWLGHRRSISVLPAETVDWDNQTNDWTIKVTFHLDGKLQEQKIVFLAPPIEGYPLWLTIISGKVAHAGYNKWRSAGYIQFFFLVLAFSAAAWLSYGYEAPLLFCTGLLVLLGLTVKPRAFPTRAPDWRHNGFYNAVYALLCRAGDTVLKAQSVILLAVLAISLASAWYSVQDFCLFNREEPLTGVIEDYTAVKRTHSSGRNTFFLSDYTYLPVVRLPDHQTIQVTDGDKFYRAYPTGTQVNLITCQGRNTPAYIDRGLFTYLLPLGWLFAFPLLALIAIGELIPLSFNRPRNG